MSGTATAAVPADAAMNSSLFAFFAAMEPHEARTFWACSAGWSLDAMDVMVYALVVVVITHQWHVSLGSAGAAASISLLTSAIGGWGAGYLSDRFGRVRMLQATILWFATFGLLSAFACSFHQLIVCRALLGLGFGGEWSAGAVLLGETIRPRLRGRAMGCMQAGWAVGWAGAVLGQAAMFSVLQPALAWRAMFALGTLPAMMIFFARRLLQEPAIAAATRMSVKPRPFGIFSRPRLRITVLAALLTTGAQGGYYAIAFWLPSFLKISRHLTILATTPYLFIVISGSFMGYLTGAWLADKLGRRPLFFIFSIGAAAAIIIYTQLELSNAAMLIFGFPLGFFSSGYYAGMGSFLTELYPTELRGSGQGFTYNIGRGIGAVFPILTGYLTAALGFGDAIAIFAVSAYVILFVAAYFLPETRGRDLALQVP